MKNEKCTLYDLEYGGKTEKFWKGEMHTMGPGICEKPEKYEKWYTHSGVLGIWWEHWKMWKMRQTQYRNSNNGRNAEKHEKWEMCTVGRGFLRENKNLGKWESHTLVPGICKK